jgi:hypothetical protein
MQFLRKLNIEFEEERKKKTTHNNNDNSLSDVVSMISNGAQKNQRMSRIN